MSDLEEDFIESCKKIDGEMYTGIPPEEGICSTEEGEMSFNPETKSAEIEDNTGKVVGNIYEANLRSQTLVNLRYLRNTFNLLFSYLGIMIWLKR